MSEPRKVLPITTDQMRRDRIGRHGNRRIRALARATGAAIAVGRCASLKTATFSQYVAIEPCISSRRAR